MFDWTKIAKIIPSVSEPVQKPTFREKAKWTIIILILFFVLGSITIWGINPNAVAQFEFLEIVFGSRFGSLISLGIGPIVTASIILQLLIGSKILNWDTNEEEGKKKFSAAQKILTLAFCFIEAVAYVIAGAVPPASPTMFLITFVIIQLAIGGIIMVFMDEVCSKWGFGSGVSLFIAAGVAKTIIVRTLNPLTQAGTFPISGEAPAGMIPKFIFSIFSGTPMFSDLLPLLATILVFIITVYIQDIRIEIPMAFSIPFGKFAGKRWPMKFLYTSNMPVILIAAVIANLQVLGRVLYSRGISFLGIYNDQGTPTSGFMYYISSPSGDMGIMIMSILACIFALLFAFIAIKTWKKHVLRTGLLGAILGIVLSIVFISFFNIALTYDILLRSLIYLTIFIIGSIIFSIFWVSTSGMDSKSIAEQFKTSSIVIPGFRHDPRFIEKVLDRYIPALTVLGGAAVGFLAAFADLTSAIGTGTGILLTVMIIYQFYEQISQQHREDMPSSLKSFFGE
jgi:preprotein translocase subunit SecY